MENTTENWNPEWPTKEQLSKACHEICPMLPGSLCPQVATEGRVWCDTAWKTAEGYQIKTS